MFTIVLYVLIIYGMCIRGRIPNPHRQLHPAAAPPGGKRRATQTQGASHLEDGKWFDFNSRYLITKISKIVEFTLPSTIHSTQKHRGNHHHCIKRHHGGWKGCYQGVVLAGACAEGRAGEELGWRMWLAVGVFPNAHTIGDAIPYQEQHFFGWSCVLRIDRNIHTESNRIDQTNPKDQHALTVDQSQKPQPKCPIG